MTWEAIAHHGMSEAEVRTAILAEVDWAVHNLRCELRADGVSAVACDYIAERVRAYGAAHIEERVGAIVRDMAATAGQTGQAVH